MAVCTLTNLAVPSKATFQVTVAHVSKYPAPHPTIHLYGNLGGALCVVQPIELTCEMDEFGQHVISDAVSLRYGVGDTIDQAMEDYKASLIDYYQALSARQDVPTRKVFDQLRNYIQSK